MLADMVAGLRNAAEFFGFACAPERLQAIATGPLMRRYSKALEHEYSPDLRRELIGEASEQFASEIDGALAMLRAAAEKSPLLARVLARASEG